MSEAGSLAAQTEKREAELSAGVIALEISSRNARVQALQDRWDRLRQVIDERAAYYRGTDDKNDSAIAGGSTGLLCKTFVGKDADQPVYKVDTGTLSMLLAHEKQAAEELGQWSETQNFVGRH